MSLGKHLLQAVSSVYTLQCLTGKVDNNNNNVQWSLLLVEQSMHKMNFFKKYPQIFIGLFKYYNINHIDLSLCI